MVIFYLNIDREVPPIRAIFIVGCGSDVKNLVQPCGFMRKTVLAE